MRPLYVIILTSILSACTAIPGIRDAYLDLGVGVGFNGELEEPDVSVIRFGFPVTGCWNVEYEHHSIYSNGRPFNDKPDPSVNLISGYCRVQPFKE